MGYIPGADCADVPSNIAIARKQQIPCGNDNKKSNRKSNCKN
jgi:hypothetical protein